MFGRRKIAALVGEFLGTGVLTVAVLTVQHSGIGYPLFVAAAAGLAIVVVSFAVGQESGGYFNPAITLGQWTIGKVATLAAIGYIIVQFLGAWLAYFLYTYLVNNHLGQVGGHFSGRILTAEAVGTGLFSFVFAAKVYGGFSRAVSASFAGLGLLVGVVVASSASIGLLNPALALGDRAWVWGTYVLGPVIGALIGTQLFRLLFAESEGGLFANFSMTSITTSETVTVKPAEKRKTSSKKSTSKKKK